MGVIQSGIKGTPDWGWNNSFSRMNKCSVLFLLLALGVQVITASVIPTEILQNNNGGVQGRSYGGSKAAAGHFLYQASLRDDEDRHFCGGCIIRLLWVLTAGRCTRPYLQNIINVVVGSHLLSSGGATHISDLILIHPDFSSVTYASDISLIKVDKPFGIGTFVKIIPLDFSITAEEESVTTSGWGEEVSISEVYQTINKINVKNSFSHFQGDSRTT